MKLVFVTKNNTEACLGTMLPLTKDWLKYYVRRHDKHWVLP